MRIIRSYARKLWVPYDGFRWPPPRGVQLLRRLRCWRHGHRWGDWRVDDYEGPGETYANGHFMPYLSREAKPDEMYAVRICLAACGAIERRVP